MRIREKVLGTPLDSGSSTILDSWIADGKRLTLSTLRWPPLQFWPK